MSGDVVGRLDAALAGRYRVEREVGSGGMAVVFLARDDKHGRPVALKVLRPELAEAVGEERFAREIEIAARLSHPNILDLYDSGVADGLPYFVMPFVEGESLRDVLDREGSLELATATRYATEIADALRYAHGEGLVHRDVKPENILLRAGHAVVCDFGIAKAVSEVRDRLTRTGTSIGTLAYMSPEQLDDEGEVGPQSDVYALGCVLHEMLEGEPPFRASTPQAAMARKLIGDLPERSQTSSAPPPVWDVVRRAVAAKAGDRYATVDEMVSALTYATTDVAVARHRRVHDRRRAAWAAALVAGVLGVGAAVAYFGGRITGPAYERLAVLPFSGAPGDDFFVQGVHEDLVDEMQRAGLRVVSPSSVRRIAAGAGALADIVEQLGVDALVEGTLERVGPRVVVDLRLIDGASQEVVWTSSLSAAQLDIINLLRGMTLAVAERVGAVLSPEAEARLGTSQEVDAVLYELLLQARYEAFRLTPESLDEAERYYERAVARDSMSAHAWLGLAGIWPLRAQQGLVPGDTARARRDRILARAPIDGLHEEDLALRLTWPDWQEGRWEEAEEAFLRTLEDRPSDAPMRAYYALLLLYLGREEEAARESERAATQAPDDPLVQGLYGQLLNALHRWDEAEQALSRARRFEPDAPMLLSTLRTTYHLQGEDSLAIESWRDSYRSSDDLEAYGALEAGYAAGGYEVALRSVAELFERRQIEGRSVSAWQIGTLYTRAGVPDKAIEYLSVAVDQGDPNCPYLSVDAIFDPLRGDPRFDALVARLRLPGRP